MNFSNPSAARISSMNYNENLNDSNAKLLSTKELYPDGANAPTVVYTYECPCKNSTLEYVTVPGFNDRYLQINCERCKEMYKIITGCGHLWELERK